MDVGIIRISLAQRVLGNVIELGDEVAGIGDAMGEVSLLPDFSSVLLAHGEGVAAFDELGGLLDGFGWREQDVDVIRHDDEAVQEEASLIAVAEDGCDKQFGVGGTLEDAAAVVTDGGKRIGLRFEAHGWQKKTVSRGLKPGVVKVRGMSGLKPEPISGARTNGSVQGKK